MRNAGSPLAVIVAAIVSFAFAATFAHAASTPILVSVKGQKQGQFKGESPRQAAKDKMEALAFSLEVASPRDAASGQASGRRQHKGIQITKQIGAASPQFFTALCTNEVLQNVTLEFTKVNDSGEEYVYYTIKLTNATVSSLRQHTVASDAAGGSKQAAAAIPQVEDITFTYQRIEIESIDGKTMAVDDWMATR